VSARYWDPARRHDAVGGRESGAVAQRPHPVVGCPDFDGLALDDRAEAVGEVRLAQGLVVLLDRVVLALFGGVIGYGIWLWSFGAVTVGAIATAAALVVRLNGMVDWIMWSLTTLFQNVGTVQEGMETMSQPLRLKDVPDAKPLKLTKGEVHFEAVTHLYGRGGGGGVSGIDLTIRGGERVGRVDHSGLGPDDLLRPQRQARGVLGRQRERLVVPVGVQRLGATHDRGEGL